ncbi:MAG: tetratricopeptide repeat protein [Candidatus Krumholzibacteriia bacterium]
MRGWGVIPAVAAGLFAIAGCAGRAPAPCGYPREIAFAGEADSLGLASFLRLPDGARAQRHEAAARWRAQAGRVRRATEAWRALATAAGLAPDDAAGWLGLAERQRELGDRAAAGRSLGLAAAAIDLAPRGGPRLRLALARAWLHRDQAEWSQGLAWTDSALALSPADREARLLQGLLLGQRGEESRALAVAAELERVDPLASDWIWVRGLAALGAESLPDALHYLGGNTQSASGRYPGSQPPQSAARAGGSPDIGRHGATPGLLHRADYWHDLGLVCERLERWSEAAGAYEASATALPLKEPACLRRVDLPVREGEAGGPLLPVWLAFDRFRAAGSWRAYAVEATRRFEAAADSGSRDFWSDAAVRALGICIRTGLAPPASRAARGRLYVQLGAYGLAEADLGRALAESRQLGRPDAATLYWLGFLRVKGERPGEALPLLREAAALEPGRAAVWSTRGYALVMTGDPGAARIALDRALALDPLQIAAWYNRGLLHFNSGRWEEAVLDLRRAAELAPDNVEVGNLLRRAVLQVQKSRREATGP